MTATAGYEELVCELLTSRRGWVERAACRNSDPELFFPVSTTGPAAGQVAEARAVCASCPVRAECLDWALNTGQADGIWGGTTPEERRTMRRNARIDA